MKKLTIIPVALMVCAGAYGQGAVAFENGSASVIKLNGTAYTAATAATAGYTGVEVALFYQPDPNGSLAPTALTSSSGQGNWQLFGVTGLVGPSGFFNGGSSVVLNGIAANANAWLEVVSWNNGATTLAGALASASVFGNSSVFSLTTIDPTVVPKITAPLLSSNPAFTGVNAVTISPEPTTIALGGLGAAALLFFRRRK